MPRPQQPVDHGYAWVACLGVAICSFHVSGPLRSYGLMFVEVNERFESSKAVAAIGLSIVSFGVAVISPIAAWLGERFSQRAVCMAGGALTSLAMILTAFAPNIYYVCATFGILSGLGLGCIFSPSLVMTGYYFKKRRAFANGLAAAGGSLGQLLIPFLFTYIMQTYTFQGGLLIFGAFLLHVLIGAALLRPVTFYSSKPKQQVTAKLPEELRQGEGLKAEKTQSLLDIRVPALLNRQNLDYTSLQDLEKHDHNLGVNVNGLHKTSSLALAPYQKPLADEIQTPQKPAPKSLRTVLSETYDFHLLRNRGYLVYVIGMCTGHMGYICTCLFLPPFARENGLTPYYVALMMAIAGGSDLLGRIVGGYVADLELMSKNNFSGGCLVVTGACALVLTLYPVFWTLVPFAVALGALGGTYVSMMLSIVIELVGIRKVSPGFSLAIMGSGLMAIPTPIVLGLLRDYTLTYNWSLAVCGMLLLFGGLMFIVSGILHKRDTPADVKEGK